MNPQNFIYLIIPIFIKYLLGGLTIHGLTFPMMSGMDFATIVASLGAIHSGSRWVEKQGIGPGPRDQ